MINRILTSFDREIRFLKKISDSFGVIDEDLRNSLVQLESEYYKPASDIMLKKNEDNVRKEILKKYIGELYKSPTSFPISIYSAFEYERTLCPERLELIYGERRAETSENLLIFRSCLSAIDALLRVISTIYQKIKLLKVCALVFYFETKSLLNIFYNHRHYEIEFLDTPDELYTYLENSDCPIFFIEMLDVNTLFYRVSIDNIVNSINNNRKINSVIIILDITIGGTYDVINEIKNRIMKNLIVFTVYSGIKLEQFGFEFSNMGIMNFSFNNRVTSNKMDELLIAARSSTGMSILHYEEKILLNCVFNKKDISDYKNIIYSNTRDIYMCIKENYRDEILNIYWNQESPFILIKLKKDDGKSYKIFIENMSAYLRYKGTELLMGTSFGFRQIRTEIINRNNDFIIRLSPGYHWGYNTNYIIQFLIDNNLKYYNFKKKI